MISCFIFKSSIETPFEKFITPPKIWYKPLYPDCSIASISFKSSTTIILVLSLDWLLQISHSSLNVIFPHLHFLIPF